MTAAQIQTTSTFRSQPVIGEFLTVDHVLTYPHSRMVKTNISMGTYLGVMESEWDQGQMMHMFEGGRIGRTEQRGRHGFPVENVRG